MHMAYQYQVRDLWVVNVGDIKPGEIGTEHFLRMGWDIRPWTRPGTRSFLLDWATRDFGADYAEAVADILETHFELGYARRPENMVQKTRRTPWLPCEQNVNRFWPRPKEKLRERKKLPAEWENKFIHFLGFISCLQAI